MRKFFIVFMLLSFHFAASSETCNDKNYAIAKDYDLALAKNPNTAEEQIRSRVAKKHKISQQNLRGIYFSCLPRLENELPLNVGQKKSNSQCDSIKKLAENIAEMKNNGASKNDVRTLVAMSNDGSGPMGDIALRFYDLHIKGTSAANFGKFMYEKCAAP